MSDDMEVGGVGGSKGKSAWAGQMAQMRESTEQKMREQLLQQKRGGSESGEKYSNTKVGSLDGGKVDGKSEKTDSVQRGDNFEGSGVYSAKEIKKAGQDGSGGSDGDSKNKDGNQAEKAKLAAAVTANPVSMLFPDKATERKVGQLVNAYQRAGVDMVSKDDKGNVKGSEAFNVLMSISDEIDHHDKENIIKNINKE